MSSQHNSEDSIARLKGYKLKYARRICLAAAFLYPISAIVSLTLDSTAVESIPVRIVVSLSFVLTFVLTYRNSFVKKYAIVFMYVNIIVAIYSLIWISSKNQFNFNYSLILLAGIAVVSSIILDKKLISSFLITTTVIIVTSIYLTSDAIINPAVLPLCTTIFLIVNIVKENYRFQILQEVNSLNNHLLNFNTDLEGKIQERTLLLNQKNEELEKFTYIVSHDLKSPLRNIGSFSSLIKKKIESNEIESIKEYSEIINKAVIRMSTILSDLLTFGKLKQIDNNIEKTDISKLINELVETDFNSKLYSNVVFELSKDFPKIYCDKNQISLLIENLLTNAIKYNQSNEKNVKVNYKSMSDYHKISITDNGIGISDKYKDQIFEMFARLHTERQYDGTGIGLSICKTIAEKHGGTLSFDSKKDSGTTFHFTISKNLEKSITIPKLRKAI